MYDCCVIVERTATMASMRDIFLFCTALEEVPPIGLENSITIEYLPDGPILPNSASCFYVIRLPISHATKESFYSKMDLGILGSNGYYGLC